MDPKPEFSAGLSVCIGKLWEEINDNFSDFTVCVEDSQYRCHRFILGACSGFFLGLFRSGMQETQQNLVELKSISSQTFELVLKAVYTSQDVLNSENIYDIWHAVNQLQIDYLIAECEKFVTNSLSLSTYEKIYDNAAMLDSRKVIQYVVDFIKLNFNECQNSEILLKLSINNVTSVVESPDLVVKSEDLVVNYIINWVQYSPASTGSSTFLQESGLSAKVETKKRKYLEPEGLNPCKINTVLESEDVESVNTTDKELSKHVCEHTKDKQKLLNERKMHLAVLLRAARLCLASVHCLRGLFNHELLRDDEEARKIVFDSTVFHSLEDAQGQWPDGAVHRRCSDLVNVGICVEGSNTLRIFSFVDKLWYRSSANTENGTLYGISCFNSFIHAYDYEDDCLKYLKEGNWTRVVGVSRAPSSELLRALFLLPILKSLYLFYPITKKIHKTNQEYMLETVCDYPFQEKIDYVASYRNTFLVFLTESNTENILETAVYSFDLISKTWTRLKNREGSAENMTVFSEEENMYILKNNGDLWRIITTPNNKPDFVFLSKLWDFKYNIYGAITYKGELFIVGEDLQVKPADKNWPEKSEQFTKIHVHGKAGLFSKFTPCILRKSLLLQDSASTSL